ncbi:hypothetical protein ES703_26901 [subsurface metagenome]
MAKGTGRYWTEAVERLYERYLAGCENFAQRHLVMSIRDLVKYDQRTKQGKRATAQARLRLATASDEDLEQLAKLRVQIFYNGDSQFVDEAIEHYRQLRERVREKGVGKEEVRA